VKTRMIDAPNGAIAVHESRGQGPAAMLIHGNSSSSHAFSRQLDGPLGERFRLVAVDLPGYGASDNATDPSAYSLPGHARAVRAAAEALGLTDARFVGSSLGGHVVLEMAPDLPGTRGFLIFGTPPIGFPPPQRGEAFHLNPAMATVFAERIDRDQAAGLVASMFKPGFADVPPFFVEDALRADRRARKRLGASLAPGGFRDEVAVVRDLKAPLAVLHGAEAPRSNSSTAPTSPRSPCRRCGAARCRSFPAPATRRNGRRPRPSTRCSRRSSPRRREGVFRLVKVSLWGRSLSRNRAVNLANAGLTTPRGLDIRCGESRHTSAYRRASRCCCHFF
jgi:pimeloyl-ACP methyl ester carboxylesterase